MNDRNKTNRVLQKYNEELLLLLEHEGSGQSSESAEKLLLAREVQLCEH